MRVCNSYCGVAYHVLFNFHIVLIILTAIYNRNVSALNDSKDLLLTSAEKNALDKFKSRVKDSLPEDFMKTDFYLIRWLRENNLDISASESMLRECVKWRARLNITKLLEEDWSDMEQDFPANVDSHDKEGRPIVDIFVGVWDIRKAVLQGRAQRMTLYLFYLLEAAMQNVFRSQAKGIQTTRFIYLADVDGFSVVQHACPLCIPIVVQYALTLTRYYPGFIDEVIVVNAPTTFAVILNIIRPLLTPDLRSQFKVFNTNRNTWLPYLRERIDENQRLPHLGGAKGTWA